MTGRVSRALEMCGSTISAIRPVPVPVVDDAYPYPTRARPVPKISAPDYIGTGDSHNTTPRQSHIGPLYIFIPRTNGNRAGKLRLRVYATRPAGIPIQTLNVVGST